MDDSVFPPKIILGTPSDSLMDFDYIDSLLLEGCWLETTDGSEFLHPSPSTSNAFFDTSFKGPTLEDKNGELSGKESQEERQRSSFPQNLSISQSQGQNSAKTQFLGENMVHVMGCSNQSENFSVEGSELSRRWWIEPRANRGPASSVMERLIRALGNVKDCTREKGVLIQIWVPVNKGNRRVLSTNDQPFSLDLNCPGLASYRDISVKYQFPAEEDSKEIVGLPGRVFMGKVPEWTPDVRFFRREEYPRLGHAQQYDVRGTLAVPVFEQGSSTCLGVIEVIMTTQKINYRPELESVCKALEAVHLRSSEVSSTQNVKVCDGSYQAALPEILEVLRSVCETHRLPLAQTWVPCIQQGKSGCRHSNENLVHCVSTVDSACYVVDPSIRGFHEACSEHHLFKGQGVAGKAFMTNQPCFSPDVTSSSKTEYPLSHYARMFGLRAAAAIRLRSIYAGTVDFVLEFFLPMDCRDPEEQKIMLTSFSIIIQKVCWFLRIITDKELQEETALPVGELIIPSDGREEMPREVLPKKASESRQDQHDSSSKATVAFGRDYPISGNGSFLNVGKTGEKRRVKAEETITLQMLQQYFAGSLKDAAKSIGVCPTTLKRICRRHGINRWPSRKIKKVGHSLEKIQLVIDSVQGTSGSFQIESFYSNLNLPSSRQVSALKPSRDSRPSNRQREGGTSSPQAGKSPSSSCSQSSSSSQCCSSGTQPNPYSLKVEGHEDPGDGENSSDGVLKRAKCDTEMHSSSDEGPKPLPRSQGHKSPSYHPKSESHPPVPKNTSENSRGRDLHRVKVTYGEEKIRLRLQNNWGYQDLLQEITRRFSIDDKSGFLLKYLDDESEWVLLTCDADLEECIDICRSFGSDTIKLSLLQNSHQHLVSSLGSSTPL